MRELLLPLGLLFVALSTLWLAIANIYATRSRNDLARRVARLELFARGEAERIMREILGGPPVGEGGAGRMIPVTGEELQEILELRRGASEGR
jgi:hypothetical protein